MHSKEEREEGERNAERGGEYRHEELTWGSDGCVPARHAVAQLLHIVVDNDNGIIHHHTQGYDEGSQGDCVQFHTEKIEDAQRREDGNRDAEGGYLCHAAWHKQDDHDDDGDDRDEQFAKEVEH